MEIKNDLNLFGLSEQEQQVFLTLASRGWSTVMQLSKSCPIKRSTLYRILDSLIQKGLVETQVDDKTSLYNAAPPEAFGSILLESEKKTESMKKSLEHIKQNLGALTTLKHTETSLRYYRGIRGLKQMEWKMLEKTNIEIQVFHSSPDHRVKILGSDFAEQMREEAVKRNVRFRSILNHEDPTLPDGTTNWTINKQYSRKNYSHRLISREIMDMKQDIIIMSDSVHFRGIRENDVVDIQIINSDYVTMMRQLFEFVWDKATVIDNFGERFS